VARLLTSRTTITVPPNILQPGSSYLLRINSVVNPGVSISTRPYQSAFPLHTAPAMSGLLTVSSTADAGLTRRQR
jgi:hypothetical protein